MDVLGYRLSLADGQLRIGLGEGAYAGLRESLAQAHAAPAPSLAAQQAVRGWLGAAGATVENGEAVERIVGKSAQDSRGYGIPRAK